MWRGYSQLLVPLGNIVSSLGTDYSCVTDAVFYFHTDAFCVSCFRGITVGCKLFEKVFTPKFLLETKRNSYFLLFHYRALSELA